MEDNDILIVGIWVGSLLSYAIFVYLLVNTLRGKYDVEETEDGN